MKKINLTLLNLFIFSSIALTNIISAQNTYCFWVGNYTDESFSSVRIRKSGSSSFGQDLFPGNLIESYSHYWIRTGSSSTSIFDVEITKIDGTPLNFTWTGNNGIEYTRPYITLDLSPLNTLMITGDEYNGFSYNDTYDDEYGFGDPCDN